MKVLKNIIFGMLTPRHIPAASDWFFLRLGQLWFSPFLHQHQKRWQQAGFTATELGPTEAAFGDTEPNAGLGQVPSQSENVWSSRPCGLGSEAPSTLTGEI